MTRTMGGKPRIVGILPTMTDTRIARRVEMLKQAGYSVEAVAFLREGRPQREPDCPVEILGRLRHGNYMARIPKFLLSLSRVRRAIRRNNIVFAFNSDMALLALVAGIGLGRPVAVDVADIRTLQVASNWRGRALRFLEKFTVNQCRLLALSTTGYRHYYREWLETDTPDLVLENKVEKSLAESMREFHVGAPAHLPQERPLRIGWFGLLRDEWSMRVLEALTRLRDKRFTAVLAGPGLVKDFSSRVASNPAMCHSGAYRHPEDLPGLYARVDMVMACYPPELPHGWSQSNRYYEACLFQKPLIVRAGCGDAIPVRQHDIGLILDSADVEGAAAAILAMAAADWTRWHRNLALLPPDAYTVTDEADVLAKAICEIAGD